MIALTARTYLKQRENAQKERAQKERSLSRFLQVEVPAPIPPAPAASVSAPPPAPATQRPAPRDQEQAGLFSRIFKQETTGIEVPHSQSERAVYVNRFGCWVEPLAPQFRRFFYQWFVLGKANPVPIHKVQKRYTVVK